MGDPAPEATLLSPWIGCACSRTSRKWNRVLCALPGWGFSTWRHACDGHPCGHTSSAGTAMKRPLAGMGGRCPFTPGGRCGLQFASLRSQAAGNVLSQGFGEAHALFSRGLELPGYTVGYVAEPGVGSRFMARNVTKVPVVPRCLSARVLSSFFYHISLWFYQKDF